MFVFAVTVALYMKFSSSIGAASSEALICRVTSRCSDFHYSKAIHALKKKKNDHKFQQTIDHQYSMQTLLRVPSDYSGFKDFGY
jgi:hypothetical protein